MPVSFNKRQQNEKAFLQKHSWRAHVSLMFPSCPYGKHCFQCQLCFQDANYAYATLQGILTKIRAWEHLQIFCEHEQASTSLNFASNSSKGQILRALSNWKGPFDTPKRILTALMPSLLFRCFSLFLPHLRTLAQEKRWEIVFVPGLVGGVSVSTHYFREI